MKSLQADSLQLPVPKPLPRRCSPHLASPTPDCQVSYLTFKYCLQSKNRGKETNNSIRLLSIIFSTRGCVPHAHFAQPGVVAKFTAQVFWAVLVDCSREAPGRPHREVLLFWKASWMISQVTQTPAWTHSISSAGGWGILQNYQNTRDWFSFHPCFQLSDNLMPSASQQRIEINSTTLISVTKKCLQMLPMSQKELNYLHLFEQMQLTAAFIVSKASLSMSRAPFLWSNQSLGSKTHLECPIPHTQGLNPTFRPKNFIFRSQSLISGVQNFDFRIKNLVFWVQTLTSSKRPFWRLKAHLKRLKHKF